MTRYVVPEPMLVPAPYGFVCPDCGERVEPDEPVAWVKRPGGVGYMRLEMLVCQQCGCTEPD